MTARAGYVAPRGLDGSSGDRRAGYNAALLAGPPAIAWRYKMIATNALGALVSWPASGGPDLSGVQYTGGNLPLSNVSVASRVQV